MCCVIWQRAPELLRIYHKGFFGFLSLFDSNHRFKKRMKIYLMYCEVRKEMVEEKGLEAAAADRIGEWVQMSGGEELVEKLLGMTLTNTLGN